MAVNEDSLRAELRSSTQRHGGVNAESAGFVGGRGHDTAFVSLATDNDRLAFQRGIEEFFDGDEEGVHVDVEDGFDGRMHSDHTIMGCVCICRARSYTRTYSRAEIFH